MTPTVSPYLLLNGIGLIVALFLLERALARDAPDCQDTAYTVLVLSGAFGWFGAHVFAWLIGSGPFTTAGFSFYGGLLSGLSFWAVAGRIFMRVAQLRRATEAAVLPFVLAHAIGRIGCLLAGCCYGRTIPGSDLRHPTQLYEAFFLGALALALPGVPRGIGLSATTAYLLSYPTFRFFVEFVRGDERGNAFGLSVPQWISLGLVLAATLRLQRAPAPGSEGW